MNARYRLVHFVPDPFLGGRIPIAALVEHGGRVSVAKLPHIPGPSCLGSRKAAALVELVLDDLTHTRQFDRLPMSIGPQCVLDKERQVPAGVDDARTWVERCIVAPMSTTATAIPEHTRRPKRSTYGYRFFQAYKVDRYVQKTFTPGHDANKFLAAASPIGPISHYVDGEREILLMEPIVLHNRPQWRDDVHYVAKTFGAYQTAIREERGGKKAQLTAYVLSGGSSGDRESIFRDLSSFADDVVDTDNAAMRARFLSRIKETGRAGSPDLFGA